MNHTPIFFSNVAINNLKIVATNEENIDYKKLSQETFSEGFNFLRRYVTSYVILKKLVTNKMSINTVNDNQKDFAFNLMKGYNVSSSFKKSETKAPIEGEQN